MTSSAQQRDPEYPVGFSGSDPVDWVVHCGPRARLELTYHRAALVAALVGTFDADAAGELRVGLRTALGQHPDLLELDGAGVGFCNASAISVIGRVLVEADRAGVAYAGTGFAPEQLRLLRRGFPQLAHDRLDQPSARLAPSSGPTPNELETELTQLRRSLATQGTIEQAKGVLMANRRCSPEEAFATLVEVAQRVNRPLSDISADLVERAGHGGDGNDTRPA